ncbi:MAG: hypothetical protein ACPG8V_03735 [Alphaproteobacteria bacterium]
MTKDIKTLTGEKPHSAVDKLIKDVKANKIDRREFLRTMALLG